MADHKKYVLSYFLNISKNRELSEVLTGLAVYKHISGGERKSMGTVLIDLFLLPIYNNSI